MVLQFQPPPDWLIQDYMTRKNPVQEGLEGVAKIAQVYANQKQQKQADDLAQQQKDIEMAKGMASNGQDFADALKQIQTARTPAAQAPVSLIDRWHAFVGGSKTGKTPTATPEASGGMPSIPPPQANPSMGNLQNQLAVAPQMATPSLDNFQPPTASTGTAPSPMTTGIPTDPMIQEYQKDPVAFKRQHGSAGMDKLKTNVTIDQALNPKPSDMFYTHDQARSTLKGNQDALDALDSFPKDKVPKDWMHLMMTKERSNTSGENMTYVGNSEDGSPVNADKHGNFYVDGSPYHGKILGKNSETPTSSTRSSAEFATTIIPHIDTMRKLIKEADEKGYIGPVAGRVYNQFMAGKVGTTGNPDADALLGRLRATDSLLKTGAMRVHFGARGGQQMYDHFSELLNSGKQSAAMMNGSLDTIQDFMKGYENAGHPGRGGGASVPTISDDAAFKALPSGSQFKDPSGQLHTKK